MQNVKVLHFHTSLASVLPSQSTPMTTTDGNGIVDQAIWPKPTSLADLEGFSGFSDIWSSPGDEKTTMREGYGVTAR